MESANAGRGENEVGASGFVEILLDGPVLPVNCEFDRDDEAAATVEELLGSMGRMLSGSKSAYRARYPDHEVAFNANLFTPLQGKLWFGDIDLTLDGSALQRVADRIGEDLFVLSEMDGRFDQEAAPRWQHPLATFQPGRG